MDQMTFTSLIVTYNSAQEALDLLGDLHQYMPDNKIIVIDNASRDGTADAVQKHFPQVQLVRNAKNVGYAKAVNQGFELCNTEYVLLLNPDIRIPSPELFAEMERCLRHFRQVAVVAPMQFKNEEGRRYLNFTWSYSAPKALNAYLSFLLHRKQIFTRPIRVTFLNAGCLFIRRSAFEQVGRLNEKYFMYGEEPDLFLKFRRYGFECYLLPNVGVTHYRERSLMTVPALSRLRLKFRAAWNIGDALINGWVNILLHNLAARQLQQWRGKSRQPTRNGSSSHLS